MRLPAGSRLFVWVVSAPLLACSAEKSVAPTAPVKIQVTSPSDTLELGDTLRMLARVVDAASRDVAAPISWSITDIGVLSVTSPGVVKGIGVGVSYVRVENGALRDSVRVTVVSIPRQLALTLGATSFNLGDSTAVVASVTDKHGAPVITNVRFRSGDTLVVRVDSLTGFVRTVGDGSASVIATSGSLTSEVPVHVSLKSLDAGGVRFTSLAMGRQHGCALTADGSAYCFGNNTQGELGNGSAGLQLTFNGGIDAGLPAVTAVSGGLHFKQIDGGRGSTCAVTTAGTAYCWGLAGFGATLQERSVPALVPLPDSAGPIASAHGSFNGADCLLASSGAAWCFGDDYSYIIGPFDSTGSSTIRTPRVIPGSPHYATIRLADAHSCGIGTDAELYCVGVGRAVFGGPGPTVSPAYPVQIATPRPFQQLALTNDATCALDAEGAAWCWGIERWGALGQGLAYGAQEHTPAMVSGGHTFVKLDADFNSVCGLTATGELWCWGQISRGIPPYNADSPYLASRVPVLFSRDHHFIDFGVNANGVCGLTSDGVIYCALSVPFPTAP